MKLKQEFSTTITKLECFSKQPKFAHKIEKKALL